MTAGQKKALKSLLSFNDEEEDEILYIDESPRPSEPWYVILDKIVPHLLTEPFRTFDVQEEVMSDGWGQIMTALDKHGQGLSLPPGVASYREIVPADLQHKLWLQCCFNDLAGLGQEEDMTLADPEEHYHDLAGLGQDEDTTLADPEEHYRIEDFIDHLRECKESVAHFRLTLDSLLARVILPEKDQPIFIQMMMDKLGLSSVQEQFADRL